MSQGAHNSSHAYLGNRRGRGPRLLGKLGRAVTLKRLEELLRGSPRPASKEKRHGS